MTSENSSPTSSQQAGGLAAEIITTGTEILLGEIVDTNAAWIAQQLREIGVNLYYKTTVGDNFWRISQVVSQAMQRSNVVIVSGGLGPTADDVTRHAIAAAAQRELHAHPQALEALKARFARLGAQMTENNLQQALIPRDAIVIENPVGTAPGFIVESTVDGHTSAVIALPGVPREMKHLMTETVLPYLRQRSGNVGVISRRIFRTIGIGESMIDNLLGELMQGHNPTVGLAAHTAQADVRITARGKDAQEADALLDGLETEIRRRIGDYIYSMEPGQAIEEVIATELARMFPAAGGPLDQGAGIALVERNTGGAIAARLLKVAGGACVAQSWIDEQLAHAPQDIQAATARAAQSQGDAAVLAAQEAAQLAARHAHAAIGLAVIGADSPESADNGVFGRGTGQTVVGVYFAPIPHAEGRSEQPTSQGDNGGNNSEHTGKHEVSSALLLPYAAGDEFSMIRIGNQVLALLWNLLLRRPKATVVSSR